MLFSFASRSGRSAVRLARLLREQEVGGSNPLAPTSFRGRSASLRITLIFISIFMCLLISCTPKPKYRGSPQAETTSQSKQKTTKKKTQPKKKAPPPVESPVKFAPPIRNFSSRKITSYFGERRNRYNSIELHKGIDIKASEGEDVLAAAPGEVIFADNQRGFGKVVIIDHGHRYVSLYAHLSSLDVRKGARVQAGDVVGRVGKTGNATGVHLHFEIRVETQAVNPLDYL